MIDCYNKHISNTHKVKYNVTKYLERFSIVSLFRMRRLNPDETLSIRVENKACLPKGVTLEQLSLARLYYEI